MATAAKAKTTAGSAAKAAPVKKTAVKTASPAKTQAKTQAKTPAKTAAKTPAKSAKLAAASSKPAAAAAADTVKPVKNTFTKTALVAHIVQASGVEPKTVKAVLGALDNTILGAVMKKGVGEFMLSGLFKVTVQDVPARKARKGIDPFTKEERVFAAKPASRRVKIRALKKLKDSAA